MAAPRRRRSARRGSRRPQGPVRPHSARLTAYARRAPLKRVADTVDRQILAAAALADRVPQVDRDAPARGGPLALLLLLVLLLQEAHGKGGQAQGQGGAAAAAAAAAAGRRQDHLRHPYRGPQEGEPPAWRRGRPNVRRPVPLLSAPLLATQGGPSTSGVASSSSSAAAACDEQPAAPCRCAPPQVWPKKQRFERDRANHERVKKWTKVRLRCASPLFRPRSLGCVSWPPRWRGRAAPSLPHGGPRAPRAPRLAPPIRDHPRQQRRGGRRQAGGSSPRRLVYAARSASLLRIVAGRWRPAQSLANSLEREALTSGVLALCLRPGPPACAERGPLQQGLHLRAHPRGHPLEPGRHRAPGQLRQAGEGWLGHHTGSGGVVGRPAEASKHLQI